MNESLDCITELMRGETVSKQTDWFTPTEARLQLQPYSQPGMEMAVACSRSPVGAVASGKHGIGMLSIGGTSDEALLGHAKNWAIHEDEAKKAGKTPDRSKWRIVTFAHVVETLVPKRRAGVLTSRITGVSRACNHVGSARW
jgi:limonene 1,2-monooxygenase